MWWGESCPNRTPVQRMGWLTRGNYRHRNKACWAAAWERREFYWAFPSADLHTSSVQDMRGDLLPGQIKTSSATLNHMAFFWCNIQKQRTVSRLPGKADRSKTLRFKGKPFTVLWKFLKAHPPLDLGLPAKGHYCTACPRQARHKET